MKDTIQQIQQLLRTLETAAEQAESASEFRAFSGLELPDIMCDVVDLLMPELKPYEAAFYLHFLRHSLIEHGTPYVRVSRRGLQSGVVKSAYSDRADRPDTSRDGTANTAMSYASAKQTLDGLEAIGAIRQEGEPNREGTLFRLLLPEEIEVCQRRRAAQQETRPITADALEADFYNVRENRIKIWERDDYHCTYCSKQLTRFTATLDHVTPVAKGGDNSADNLVTACLQCNSRKTARPLGDFLAEEKQ